MSDPLQIPQPPLQQAPQPAQPAQASQLYQTLQPAQSPQAQQLYQSPQPTQPPQAAQAAQSPQLYQTSQPAQPAQSAQPAQPAQPQQLYQNPQSAQPTGSDYVLLTNNASKLSVSNTLSSPTPYPSELSLSQTPTASQDIYTDECPTGRNSPLHSIHTAVHRISTSSSHDMTLVGGGGGGAGGVGSKLTVEERFETFAQKYLEISHTAEVHAIENGIGMKDLPPLDRNNVENYQAWYLEIKRTLSKNPHQLNFMAVLKSDPNNFFFAASVYERSSYYEEELLYYCKAYLRRVFALYMKQKVAPFFTRGRTQPLTFFTFMNEFDAFIHSNLWAVIDNFNTKFDLYGPANTRKIPDSMFRDELLDFYRASGTESLNIIGAHKELDGEKRKAFSIEIAKYFIKFRVDRSFKLPKVHYLLHPPLPR